MKLVYSNQTTRHSKRFQQKSKKPKQMSFGFKTDDGIEINSEAVNYMRKSLNISHKTISSFASLNIPQRRKTSKKLPKKEIKDIYQ